jgi:FO synthase
VKLGPQGSVACLEAGCNDLGGTLMNESISRAAGADHGQELSPPGMRTLIASLGRTPRQRDTLYRTAGEERQRAAMSAPPLAPVVNSALQRAQGERLPVRDLESAPRESILRESVSGKPCVDPRPEHP